MYLGGGLVIRGISAAKGIGVGRAYIITHNDKYMMNKPVINVNDELLRLSKGIAESRKEVALLISMIEEADIDDKLNYFHVFLDNDKYIGSIKSIITFDCITSELAIKITTKEFMNRVRTYDGEGSKLKIHCLEELSKFIINNLEEPTVFDINHLPKNTIIVTDELNISEINSINEEKVVGIVMGKGGVTSHAALVAKTLDIPLVVSATNASVDIVDGDIIIIDGDKGLVIRDPGIEMINQYAKKMIQYQKQKVTYEDYINKRTRTKNGVIVKLFANVSSQEEVEKAVKYGAEGIGLYRTEVEFFNAGKAISEDEQYEIYQQAILKADNLPIVFRTLDIGGDKFIKSINPNREENPFLGLRGIRFSLKNKLLFVEQIRALLRASIHGEVSILIPMISSSCELDAVKGIIRHAKKSLKELGYAYGDPKVGMMIEVPSVAIMSDLFAQKTDFFSIGTNDLIQYTVGVDRSNCEINHLFSEYNPAVLRLIELVASNAAKNKIPFSICGDMAINSYLVPLFIELGIRNFSIPARFIREIRWVINQIDTDTDKKLRKVLQLSCENEIKKYLMNSNTL